MVNLGLMELKELNIDEAKKWIYRAAEKGNPNAKEVIFEYKLDKLKDPHLDPAVCE